MHAPSLGRRISLAAAVKPLTLCSYMLCHNITLAMTANSHKKGEKWPRKNYA
jgi:hypothetical protein